MSATSQTDPIPHSVAETLQVTTDIHQPAADHGVPVNGVTLNSQPIPPASLPSVGASISVPDTVTSSGGLSDRSSSALLSLASSCSLTEILNAQQQALEQFQCQLQLAQQTEAINQRLDAIERTLNTLIQQRAQDEAAKNAAVAAAAAAVVNSPVPTTQLRPSQQLQLPSSPPGGEGKKKLPRELCSKVRSTYNSLGVEFKIDERFLSPANQRVTETLIDHVYNESAGIYNVKDIKRAVHRYYESRRRIGIEEMPERQEKAMEQKKKRKYRARQQRAYDRRRKFVRETEMRYWEFVSPPCMTEESDTEDNQSPDKIITHQLMWRSAFLTQFIEKLDARYERSRKPGPGVSANARRERIEGQPSTSLPPPGLPLWMIDPAYHQAAGITVSVSLSSAVSGSHSDLVSNASLHDHTTSLHDHHGDHSGLHGDHPSLHGDHPGLHSAHTALHDHLHDHAGPLHNTSNGGLTASVIETTTVGDDVTYSLIDIQDVKDESSDFELPEDVTVL